MGITYKQTIYIAGPAPDMDQLIADLAPRENDADLWPAVQMPVGYSRHAALEIGARLAAMTPDRVAALRSEWGRPDWMPVTCADIAWAVLKERPPSHRPTATDIPASGRSMSVARLGLAGVAGQFSRHCPGSTDPATGLWDPYDRAVTFIGDLFDHGDLRAEIDILGVADDMMVIRIDSGWHDGWPPGMAAILPGMPRESFPGMILLASHVDEFSEGDTWTVKLPGRTMSYAHVPYHQMQGSEPLMRDHHAHVWVRLREAGVPEGVLHLVFGKSLADLNNELESAYTLWKTCQQIASDVKSDPASGGTGAVAHDPRTADHDDNHFS